MGSERDVVAAQLGREPRSAVSVAVRCEHGLPMVVRNPPALETGEPFPTRYWLTCPLAIRALSRLEHAGAMRVHEQRLSHEPKLAEAYREAHERYLTERDGEVREDAPSAGGMPARVKCLHALYAHELADANPIGALARAGIEPLGCPGPCVEGSDGRATRVAGHPAFRRSRR